MTTLIPMTCPLCRTTTGLDADGGPYTCENGHEATPMVQA